MSEVKESKERPTGGEKPSFSHKRPISSKLPAGTTLTYAERKSKLADTLDFIKQIIKAIHGQEDVRNRLGVFLDPTKPQSSSNLNADQVNFVVDAFWMEKTYPKLFACYGDLARELLATNPSLNGWAVDKSIELNSIIEGNSMLKGMLGTVQERKTRLPSFNKEGAKQ